MEELKAVGVGLEPGKEGESEKDGNWTGKQITEAPERIRTFS